LIWRVWIQLNRHGEKKVLTVNLSLLQMKWLWMERRPKDWRSGN
jgi:hypothetical protein